jgi:hypothetical protein
MRRSFSSLKFSKPSDAPQKATAAEGMMRLAKWVQKFNFVNDAAPPGTSRKIRTRPTALPPKRQSFETQSSAAQLCDGLTNPATLGKAQKDWNSDNDYEKGDIKRPLAPKDFRNNFRRQEQCAEQSKQDCKPVQRHRDSTHHVFVAHAHKHAACKQYFLTECSNCLWPANKKVDQPADKMKAEDDDHPNQFLDAVETFVGNSVDEHPNPKNARRDGESSN